MNTFQFKSIVASTLGKPFSDDLEVWDGWDNGVQSMTCNINLKLEFFDLSSKRGRVGLATAVPETTLECTKLARECGLVLRIHCLQKAAHLLEDHLQQLYLERGPAGEVKEDNVVS